MVGFLVGFVEVAFIVHHWICFWIRSLWLHSIVIGFVVGFIVGFIVVAFIDSTGTRHQIHIARLSKKRCTVASCSSWLHSIVVGFVVGLGLVAFIDSTGTHHHIHIARLSKKDAHLLLAHRGGIQLSLDSLLDLLWLH
jgi:tetrahydromethanopterin S-methyltransferase subunit B